MVRNFLISAFMLNSFFVSAQTVITTPQEESGYLPFHAAIPPRWVNEGTLRFQGTLSAGRMTGFKTTNIMLHGDIEYYFENNLSVRSDIYYQLDSKSPNELIEPFKFYHNLFTGLEYHFNENGKSDFYIGFQPGLGLGQRDYVALYDTCSTCNLEFPAATKTVSPLISFNTGYTYFASRFFNLFVHGRYIWGMHSDNYTSASLGEFRISFGLGFHFNAKKVFRRKSF